MEEGTYRIPIGERWSLEDLYVFPRAYEQVYYLMCSLLPQEDYFAVERIVRAYSAFPWQGGYSAVNFYNQLKYVLPKRDRPFVVSLQFGSPGWIDLALLVGVALSVERLIKAIAGSIGYANAVYHDIHTGLQKRKLLRLEAKRKDLELEREQMQYVEQSVQRMTRLLGFKNLDEINERTGSPLITLKILLSFYRRLRTLAEYQNRGKTRM